MQIELDVTMTIGKMYDYMLYHMFTRFQGILIEAIGVLLIAAFVATGHGLYLIIGIIVIFSLPIALYVKARKLVVLNPLFKESVHYILEDKGITIKTGEEIRLRVWEQMNKAISTGKSIILYTDTGEAIIFSRSELADRRLAIIEIISTHMEPKKVNIRG